MLLLKDYCMIKTCSSQLCHLSLLNKKCFPNKLMESNIPEFYSLADLLLTCCRIQPCSCLPFTLWADELNSDHYTPKKPHKAPKKRQPLYYRKFSASPFFFSRLPDRTDHVHRRTIAMVTMDRKKAELQAVVALL